MTVRRHQMKQTTIHTEVGFVKEILGILPKSVELLSDKCVLLDVVYRLIFVCLMDYRKTGLLTK